MNFAAPPIVRLSERNRNRGWTHCVISSTGHILHDDVVQSLHLAVSLLLDVQDQLSGRRDVLRGCLGTLHCKFAVAIVAWGKEIREMKKMKCADFWHTFHFLFGELVKSYSKGRIVDSMTTVSYSTFKERKVNNQRRLKTSKDLNIRTNKKQTKKE